MEVANLDNVGSDLLEPPHADCGVGDVESVNPVEDCRCLSVHLLAYSEERDVDVAHLHLISQHQIAIGVKHLLVNVAQLQVVPVVVRFE